MYRLLVLGLLWYCQLGVADSVSDIVGGLLDPINGTVGLLRFIFGITGVAFLLVGLIKLKEYCQQTTETGMASIIMMLIVGCALLGLIFVPMS